MKKTKSSLTKLAIVATMIGVFSPSVSLQTDTESSHFTVSLFHAAEARRVGGTARSRPSGNVNRNVNRNVNKNVNRNVNHNVNVNKNVNVNVHNTNRYYGGYGRGYGYYGGRAIVGYSTGLAVGVVVASSSMPTTCVVTYVNGIRYKRCGSTYYQPFYEGNTMVYKVVVVHP